MIYWRYLLSLLRHKWYVFLAGRVTGVPLWRLVIHDWSKFTPAEFGRYARNFHGDYSESPADKETVSLEFACAWLHHENLNPHHWGYWIPRSGRYAGQPLPMPETYVRGMVADWMGAGRAYTGSWDIAAWLNANGPKMSFHDETVRLVATVMTEMGYYRETGDWSWRPGPSFWRLMVTRLGGSG